MERRFRMDFFMQDSDNTSDEVELYPFYLEDEELIYAGREIHVNGQKITYYIWPTGEDNAILFLYIGDDTFDEFVNNIDEYNLEALTNAFPLLMRALYNGINRNISEIALLPLKDLTKDDDVFWCLGTRLDNIDISDLDTKYIAKKLMKLYQDTIELFVQLNENEVSTWDKIKGAGKAAGDGYRKGRTIASVLSVAASIGGAVFGIPGLGDLFSDNS